MALDIDIRALDTRVGEEVAVSDWMTVSQEIIDQFADATGDHQWIHVDRARAEQSPFKNTIAHGFLTLSLTSTLLRSAINPTGLRMAINYGLNRVRFIAPVPSGSRIRGRFVLAAVEQAGGAIQATWNATIEREGGDRPVCAIECLVRYYPPTP